MTNSKVNLRRDLRNRRLWKSLAVNLLAALGLLSAIIGLTDVLFPDLFADVPGPWIASIPIAAVVWSVYRSWPYPVEQHYASPDTKISIVTGNLFDQSTSLVIGMSDTFDIQTPHIISSKSVQGQFLEKVYHQDVDALRSHLSSALHAFTPIQTVKKRGNTSKYALGTVATIRNSRTQYFCVAYTVMDENCNVSSTIGILWDSLDKLWSEVRSKSNGDPVSTPILGLGQSGLSTVLPIQDAVRLLILSFMLASRRARVCEELRIVVRPEDEARLDMLELQDFLDSLKKSP